MADPFQSWPDHVREIARATVERYGPPDLVGVREAIWYNSRPFRRTILTKQGNQHNFPGPHKDHLEQIVGYDVPVDRIGDVIAFDGSVHVYRTLGELGARCDFQGANFLALNLAVQVALGKDPDRARDQYTAAIRKHGKGQDPPIMQRLIFKPKANTGDPDEKTL